MSAVAQPAEPGRRVVLLVWVVLLAAAAAAILGGARFSTDMTAFLPRAVSEADVAVEALLQRGPASRTVLAAVRLSDPRAGSAGPQAAQATRRRVGALASALADALMAAPVAALFDEVLGGGQSTMPGRAALMPLLEHRYLLGAAGAPADPFSVAALRTALEARLAELSSPLGMPDREFLASDPTAALRGVLLRLLPEDMELGETRWLAPDGLGDRPGATALIVVQTAAAGSDLDAQVATLAAVRSAFKQLPGADDAELLLSGPPTFAVQARATISGQARSLSLIASAALVAWLFIVYRSPRMLVFGIVPVATGMLLATAATALAFDTVHGITLAFGITLLGVTLDYPLHLYSHARGGEPLAVTMRGLWPTLRLGVLTTAFAFAVLGVSEFAGMAQLAVFAACGLLGAAATARWVLPALFPKAWRARRAPLPVLPTLDVVTACRVRSGLQFGLPLLAAAGVIVLVLRGDSLWENDLASLSPIPAEAALLDRRLRAVLPTADARHLIVVVAPDEATALARSEALHPWLAQLRAAGAIDGFDMAARYLPSPARQREYAAALPGPAGLESRLRAAMQGLPFRPKAFAPFLEAVERSRTLAPVSSSELVETPLGRRIRPLLFKVDGGRVLALVQLRGVADVSALSAGADAVGVPGTWHLDLKQRADGAIAKYRNDSLRQIAVAVPLMLLALWLALRDARRVLRIAAALACAVTLDLAALALLGGRLSLFHLVSVVLIVGIGIDYGLFFSRPSDGDSAARRTRHGIAVCAWSTMLVFGLLATSSLPVLHSIGLTVAIGVATAWLCAWAFLGASPPSATGTSVPGTSPGNLRC